MKVLGQRLKFWVITQRAAIFVSLGGLIGVTEQGYKRSQSCSGYFHCVDCDSDLSLSVFMPYHFWGEQETGVGNKFPFSITAILKKGL